MMQVRQAISILAVSLCFLSCGQRTKEVEEGRIRPVAYSEGDTLELDPYPENLASWLSFYGSRFHDFRNGTFLASGVVLHWDSLARSPVQDIPDSSLVYWNQDRSRYIDLSYLRAFVPPDDTAQVSHDMDQEVSLGGAGMGARRILLTNGPSVSVESADWLAKDAFLLTQVTADERQRQWSPEIYLFSLKDSTFTNFRWTRTIPQDSLSGLGEFKDVNLLKWIRKTTKKEGRIE